MTHDLFGKMKYKGADECWVGSAPLARFAEYGARAEQLPPTEREARQMIADMNRAIDDMRGLMREQFGAAADDAFAAIDAEVDEGKAEPAEPDPHDAERLRRRQEKTRKRAERLARGRYPVRIADPDESGLTPPQEVAFRHLTENEPVVLDAVLAEVWESFRNAYGQEYWRQIAGITPAATPAELRGRFGVTRVELTRQHRGGFAHLVFTLDSDWQDDHGLLVVYSPDTRVATWTSYEGLFDLIPTDDPPAGEDEHVLTAHDELVEAVLNGDEVRARELVVAGADINAVAPDEYPPLCMAVDQLEVEEVRRLLAFGADPNLVDPEEKKTPLKMAKRTYREMGFGAAKKKDALFEAMMTMAREAAGKQFAEMKTRLEEIIQLLEGAGGK
ncbi:MAG: hypothetical protein JWO38_7110 [Gemmataceae bacterium]|nr:hypothetical protein [Gemmataceae bacterium]